MPPIPKFAKALAKLAKANPKVIPGETTPKIKERNTSEKTIEKQIKTKKFAKDDMELDKIRREKIKKKLGQILPKKAKDDSELLSIARNLQNRDTKGINESEALKYIKEYQAFLKIFKLKAKNSSVVFNLLNKLNSTLDTVQSSKKFNIQETNSLIQEINSKYKVGDV